MAVALLALVESAPSSRVELVLTGASGSPVSAAPRTLSDVAREPRQGRRAVGGFSAIETTVWGSDRVVVPAFARDVPSAGRGSEPEADAQPASGVVTIYVPSGTGGTVRGGGIRRSFSLATPAAGQRRAFRPFALPAVPRQSGAVGHSRQRPG
jgi:hypothetical protein